MNQDLTCTTVDSPFGPGIPGRPSTPGFPKHERVSHFAFIIRRIETNLHHPFRLCVLKFLGDLQWKNLLRLTGKYVFEIEYLMFLVLHDDQVDRDYQKDPVGPTIIDNLR